MPLELHSTMAARDPGEAHRASTPLELFFDLTFVVAIAQCAASTHHAVVEGHAIDVLTAYPSVFFAIWWAWMNFTWFGSAYDTDDVLYRLGVFVQMVGVLILAAGVPRAFDDGNFAVVTLGYAVMRVALVAQWARAAASDPIGRPVATRYAVGVATLQLGWIALLTAPEDIRWMGFVLLVALELLVPAWAERHARTAWHPGHIAERYGLFTIIVLGESVLASTVAIQQTVDGGVRFSTVATTALGGFLIVCAMWWLYFAQPVEQATHRARELFETSARYAFIWGYGHYFVFGAAAGTGAGIAIAVDVAADHASGSRTTLNLALTVPIAVYVSAVWALHVRRRDDVHGAALVVVATAAVIATTFTGEPALLSGLVLAGLVTAETARRRPGSRSHPVAAA